jgi:hypothetical protein
MAGMDAATYHRLAAQYGACDEERDHELACARSDLQHRPETVHGRDAHQIAADALTASRALPQRHLQPVQFAPTNEPAWTPGQALAVRRR